LRNISIVAVPPRARPLLDNNDDASSELRFGESGAIGSGSATFDDRWMLLRDVAFSSIAPR
jgi:hypothetical protein